VLTGRRAAPAGARDRCEYARITDLSPIELESWPVLNPHDLYELTGDLPDLGRPVLVQALTGFVDAGNATYLARDHLLKLPGAQLIAAFDADQLIDYRSRRPPMAFVDDHWEQYDEPTLGLHLLRDEAGTPFLLLAGSEPDLQWERFTAAVLDLVERLGVRLTVGLNAIPMGVPHTRPVGVTAHGTRPELTAGYEPWLRQIQVPGSAGALLEYRLGRHGQDAMGFAVHVPHYLAQSAYPAAAQELLAAVSRATGLLLPTPELRSAAELVRADVDRQIAQNEDVSAVVRGLEEQYDAYVRGRQGTGLLAESGPLPSADELGAELERFLAEHNKPTDPPLG
jgi:predicted ATP-grasp superfamily ATP-dependent carboligase